MSNRFINYYGCGNDIPNGGHNVVRDDAEGKYYVFENNALTGNNGAMEYVNVTTNGQYSIKRSLEMEGLALEIIE